MNFLIENYKRFLTCYQSKKNYEHRLGQMQDSKFGGAEGMEPKFNIVCIF